MKDDKICFSKTLTYLVLLVAVVFSAFWVMNYANTQKLGSMPKANVVCKITPKACNGEPTNVVGSNKLYYYNQIDRKNYKDRKCYQSIPEGVGNYCKGLSGNSVNADQTCVRAYCSSPNGSKTLYTKGSRYYLNSSCLGVVGTNFNSAFSTSTSGTIEGDYCKKSWSDLIPLQYNCPSPNTDVTFYYQNGQFYKDLAKTVKITDFGVGNFCKITGSSQGVDNTDVPNKSLITTSCKELGISTTDANGKVNQNKAISVYAEDLYTKNADSFAVYFLGSSRAAPFVNNIGQVKTYCSAVSGNNYGLSNCLQRQCSGIAQKYFEMKNNKLYKWGSNCSTLITYSKACE